MPKKGAVRSQGRVSKLKAIGRRGQTNLKQLTAAEWKVPNNNRSFKDHRSKPVWQNPKTTPVGGSRPRKSTKFWGHLSQRELISAIEECTQDGGVNSGGANANLPTAFRNPPNILLQGVRSATAGVDVTGEEDVYSQEMDFGQGNANDVDDEMYFATQHQRNPFFARPFPVGANGHEELPDAPATPDPEEHRGLELVIRIDGRKQVIPDAVDVSTLLDMWMLDGDTKVKMTQESAVYQAGLQTVIELLSGQCSVDTSGELMKLIDTNPGSCVNDLVIAVTFADLVSTLPAKEIFAFFQAINLITGWSVRLKEFVAGICKIKMLNSIGEVRKTITNTAELPVEVKICMIEQIGGVDNIASTKTELKSDLVSKLGKLSAFPDSAASRVYWVDIGMNFLESLVVGKTISIMQLMLKKSLDYGLGTNVVMQVVDQDGNTTNTIDMHLFIARRWGFVLNGEVKQVSEDDVTVSDIRALIDRIYFPFRIPKITYGIVKLMETFHASSWEQFLFGRDGFNVEVVNSDNLHLFLSLIIHHENEERNMDLIIEILNSFRPITVGIQLAKLSEETAKKLFAYEMFKSEVIKLYQIMKGWAYAACGRSTVVSDGKRVKPPQEVVDKFMSVVEMLDIYGIGNHIDIVLNDGLISVDFLMKIPPKTNTIM